MSSQQAMSGGDCTGAWGDVSAGPSCERAGVVTLGKLLSLASL